VLRRVACVFGGFWLTDGPGVYVSVGVLPAADSLFRYIQPMTHLRELNLSGSHLDGKPPIEACYDEHRARRDLPSAMCSGSCPCPSGEDGADLVVSCRALIQA
jgi:hypothetical protein